MLRSSRSGAANRTERARAPLSSAQSCRYSFPFGRCGESFLRLCFFFSARSLKRKKSNAPRPPQDGSYLSELLLDKGYVVHGLKRRASSYNHPRIEHIMDSSEFFVFVLEAPNRVQKRESLFFFAHRNSTNKKYRLPRLGALLPPLRRPDRLWLALPAAQVRGKKEERERKGAYFEGEKWLFFRAISFSSRESDAAADDKRQRNSKS